MIERSQQTHIFKYHNAMRFPGTVQLMLQGHRKCTSGKGDSEASCSTKRGLLLIRQKAGWTFPVPTAVGAGPLIVRFARE